MLFNYLSEISGISWQIHSCDVAYYVDLNIFYNYISFKMALFINKA